MHGTRLKRNQRYLYLNPIEGVLICYKTVNKFPHMPNQIIYLNKIRAVEFMLESKWYFSRGQYYMRVVNSDDKELVFLNDNLDIINFWVHQIILAKSFYSWLKGLLDTRYKIRAKADCEYADSLINTVMKLALPEVDMDQYC